MLEIEPLLIARLKAIAALTGWRIAGGSEPLDHSTAPVAQVRLAAVAKGSELHGAAQLQPTWAVVLFAPRGMDAASQLGTALQAVVEALHNWSPGKAIGRTWTPFQFASIQEAALDDSGLVGYEVAFTTTALFYGQP